MDLNLEFGESQREKKGMNNNYFRFRAIGLIVCACLSNNVLADDFSTNPKDVAQLRKKLNELSQRYESQSSALLALSQRLQQLESANQSNVKPIRAVNKVLITANDDAPQTKPYESKAELSASEPVVKEAPASRSAEAVYREQNALFNQTFTLEAGASYSHSDRRQLILDGFLALDAIFLGNINLDRIKSDVVQFDITGRYGVTDRLQFDFNAPFIYRNSTYESGGVGGSSQELSQHDVNTSNIGDVSAGAYYRLFAETQNRPDVVVNMRVKAPTGKNPYGIKFRQVAGNNNLSAPEDLPTGNGVWSVSTGLSFVKTIDPAILFANASYVHNFTRTFDDISSNPTSKAAGDVDLGDSYQLGGGMAFALNERMSLSMSYAHRFAQRTRIKQQGSYWNNIIGSDSSSGSLNFGVTYAMSDRLSMVTNIGMGVTPDAPDVTVGVKFPYNF
jgi:opacity protein-like surface antigen